MKRISLNGLDVSRVGLGTMAMSGYYQTRTATTPNRSAPSSEHWSWASRLSTPPRSTARTSTRNSSAAP